MNIQWVKNRWKEARWGAFNYLVPFTAVINIILLAALKFDFNGVFLYAFGSGLFSIFILTSTLIGHFHGSKQQTTDALMEMQPVIDVLKKDIRDIIKDELRAKMEIENR